MQKKLLVVERLLARQDTITVQLLRSHVQLALGVLGVWRAITIARHVHLVIPEVMSKHGASLIVLVFVATVQLELTSPTITIILNV